MSSPPSKYQQVVKVHAPLICEVVKASQNADGAKAIEPALNAASQNGWASLVIAIRKILKGERSQTLFASLDEEDTAIIEAILNGIQNPSTLPDPNEAQDPSLAAPGLAAMITAAGSGDVSALQAAATMAEQMSMMGHEMAEVASVIRRLINGERDPNQLCAKMGAESETLIIKILDELGKIQSH